MCITLYTIAFVGLVLALSIIVEANNLSDVIFGIVDEYNKDTLDGKPQLEFESLHYIIDAVNKIYYPSLSIQLDGVYGDDGYP